MDKQMIPISVFIGEEGAQPFAIALDHVVAYEWDYRSNPTRLLIRLPGSTGTVLDKKNGEAFCERFLAFKRYQVQGG